ncbi:CBS domain-containing protein [Streptomyces sp. NBC_01803]|uniref:CBS domain-containing protein n=1 Tax=Streptomyces sp. NBC_01803 TaxID=2975946 RepID=UPI002DDB3DC3|nr:CBS domain-containing protein [Streptomyces sp. NBC_01803]WSA43412.1 CBS domain-containing protein [Streptomyces sp. NBC_01803]
MARTVAELMTREPSTVGEQDTVARAAQLMKDNDTGNVAVVEDGRLVGIITDRDIAVRVVAADRPAATRVGEAASHERLVTISPETTLGQAASVMREKSVRRLPVVRDDTLVGIISMGDLAIEADSESGLADISAAEPNA